MKLASKSAIESASSAKAGSKDSSGKAEEVLPPCAKVWLSRSDVRELGRRGVVGREGVLFSMEVNVDFNRSEVRYFMRSESITEPASWTHLRFGQSICGN